MPAPVIAQPPQLTLLQRSVKRSVDILGALTFFLLLGPVYLAVALAVRISMGHPVHFWQTRMGEGGQRFRFYKFRSMVRNSENILDEYLSKNDVARTQWDTFQKLEKDPRITPLGHFIRKLSLDELPQFWNVLKGDMSLIGPRPCMERQRSLYGKHWEHYCAMRPGITGLWQVSGRNDVSYRRRVAMDTLYARRRTIAVDLKILIMTAPAVLLRRGSY